MNHVCKNCKTESIPERRSTYCSNKCRLAWFKRNAWEFKRAHVTKTRMKIEDAEKKIREAGGDVAVFHKWMTGQTMGINPDGTTDIYDYDVNRFIRYRCNPNNEPLSEVD